jgi:hypothetical protein
LHIEIADLTELNSLAILKQRPSVRGVIEILVDSSLQQSTPSAEKV